MGRARDLASFEEDDRLALLSVISQFAETAPISPDRFDALARELARRVARSRNTTHRIPVSSDCRPRPLSPGSDLFANTVTEINERIRSEAVWRHAAIYAMGGLVDHFNFVRTFMTMPPEMRDTEFRDNTPLLRTSIFLAALLRFIRGSAAERAEAYQMLRAAATLEASWPDQSIRAGLDALVPAGPVSFTGGLGPVITRVSSRLLSDDSNALERLRWCTAFRCISSSHPCRRTGGPLFVVRAPGWQHETGNAWCCTAHRKAAERDARATCPQPKTPEKR
jgi:hypothetical protein